MKILRVSYKVGHCSAHSKCHKIIFARARSMYRVCVGPREAHGIRVPLQWRDESAPGWYRDVIQMCLHTDPRDRPSAPEVLLLLEQGELGA